MLKDRVLALRGQIDRYSRQIDKTEDARLRGILRLLLNITEKELSTHERNALATRPLEAWSEKHGRVSPAARSEAVVVLKPPSRPEPDADERDDPAAC